MDVCYNPDYLPRIFQNKYQGKGEMFYGKKYSVKNVLDRGYYIYQYVITNGCIELFLTNEEYNKYRISIYPKLNLVFMNRIYRMSIREGGHGNCFLRDYGKEMTDLLLLTFNYWFALGEKYSYFTLRVSEYTEDIRINCSLMLPKIHVIRQYYYRRGYGDRADLNLPRERTDLQLPQEMQDLIYSFAGHPAADIVLSDLEKYVV